MFAHRPLKPGSIGVVFFNLRRIRVAAAPYFAAVPYLAAAACFALTSCSPVFTPTERAASADKTVGWLVQRYGVVSDPQLEPMIHRVTERLSAAIYRSALENQLSQSQAEQFAGYKWEIIVLDTEAPNAFSAGAGRIVITRGLITSLRNESELAAIIAHEMSHEILGHNTEALAHSAATRSDDDTGDENEAGKADSRSAPPAPLYSFNPQYEVDADTLGVTILFVARYNTTSALYALTLGYRNGKRSVDDNQAEWARYRAAHLKQMVDQLGERQPATVSTREFNKVRWDLGGG